MLDLTMQFPFCPWLCQALWRLVCTFYLFFLLTVLFLLDLQSEESKLVQQSDEVYISCPKQEYFKENKKHCVVLFVESDMIITARKISTKRNGNSDTVVKIVLVLLPSCTSSAKLMPWLHIFLSSCPFNLLMYPIDLRRKL